jgi:hypothetical protein
MIRYATPALPVSHAAVCGGNTAGSLAGINEALTGLIENADTKTPRSLRLAEWESAITSFAAVHDSSHMTDISKLFQ